MGNITKLMFLGLVISIVCSCTISGTVTDEQGAPLSGVTVRLSGPLDLETTTDASGYYAFSDPQITKGAFTVTPSFEGCEFVPTSRKIRVRKQDVDGVDFEGVCNDTSITTMNSDLGRDTDPDITLPDVETLVAGNTDFALKLYQRLGVANGSDNLFLSPYSLSTALAMLYGGAKGDTEAQMADCLVFNLPQAFVHSGFNYLDLALSSRAKLQDNPGNPEISGDIFNLNISNAIWLQQGYPVLSDYLDNLALNYGAGIYLLDFMTQPEPSRLAINEWVARQTEDRIQNLLPAKSIDILTRMVLTNTIYFNAYWVDPFKVENTKAEPFYPLSDSAVTADMMHQTEYFRYAVGDNYQAVELPYWSDQKAMAMVLLVPDAGQFEAFEAGLNGNQIASINSQLQSTYIDLAMPKWEYRSSFNLKAVLSDLGMTDVFIEELADLSGINGHRELFASDVIHQAFVKVNEAGTEAAAATAIPVAGSGLPPVPVEVNIDRPFIFLIHDRPTGTVIFLGRVLDPS